MAPLSLWALVVVTCPAARQPSLKVYSLSVVHRILPLSQLRPDPPETQDSALQGAVGWRQDIYI
jgi:hypothetical protein